MSKRSSRHAAPATNRVLVALLAAIALIAGVLVLPGIAVAATVPTAPPTAVTASLGPNGVQVLINWTAATANNGGSAYTKFIVTSSPGGILCTATGVSATSCDYSNVAQAPTALTKGTYYTFTVKSYNTLGASATASTATNPGVIPGAPVQMAAPTAAAGKLSATVTWVAPADNGNAITSFTATATPSGRTCTMNSGAATSCTISGLTANTSYTFTVVATNGWGQSQVSPASAAVIAYDIASAPQNVVATANGPAGTVTLTWTAPASNNGSAITGYSSFGGGGSCTASGATATTCTIPAGQPNYGASSTYSVYAINAAGNGNTGAAPAITPSWVPTAPTGSTSYLSHQVTLVLSSLANGSPITAYSAISSPGGFTCTTTGSGSCTVTGLTNGQAYTFTATATNANGTSPSSQFGPVTPLNVPSAPTNVQATPGNGAATVTWAAPTDNGGSPVTGYTVTLGSGGCSVGPSVFICTVSGLAPGNYQVDVKATNAKGTGPAGSATVTPYGLPGAPISVNASLSGPQSITVSWTAAFANNSPITNYTVTSSPGGKTCTTTGATSCTIGALNLNTSYTFTVTATNAAGQGPASTASNSVRTNGVPDPPTGVSATAGAGSATVAWTAPVYTGGSLTGYTVTSSPGGNTCTTAVGTTSCTITGLTAGTSYTFVAVATNGYGNSLGSTPSNAVVPYTTPGAPTAVSGTGSYRSIVISWSPPANDGGAPITGYSVTASPTGAGCSTTGQTSCTVSGLSDGTSYTFTVTATNAAGQGPASQTSTPVTTAAVPSAPMNPSAVPASQSATISWSPPASNGGSALTGYTVTSNPGGASCSVGADMTSCTITGLTNGTDYAYSVYATNQVGNGPAATTGAVGYHIPDSPTAVTASPITSGYLTISWTAGATNGSPITSYAATSSPGGFTCTSTSATSCFVGGLTNGTPYAFTVTETNAYGTSAPSAPSAPQAPYGAPAAPTGVTAVAGNRSGVISWSAPTDTGGSPITGYTVSTTPYSTGCTTTGATTCSLSGLTNGSAYSVSVTATNAYGTSGAAQTSFTPVGPPTAPQSITATSGNGQSTVSWVAPSNNGGATITSYVVTFSPGGTGCTSLATTCTVTGLTNGTTYSISVTATNSYGTGPAGTGTVLVGLPGAPTNVTGVSGDSQVAVSWGAAPANGNPITGYTVTSSPGGKLCTTTGALGCTVTGLTNGSPYTFSVTATNIVGTGPAAVSGVIRPAAVPGAPGTPSATPGNAQVSLVWTAPASNGGATVTSYTITATDLTNAANSQTSTSVSISMTFTGLINGDSYTFTVAATNSVGTGPASTPSSVVSPFLAGTVTSSFGAGSDNSCTTFAANNTGGPVCISLTLNTGSSAGAMKSLRFSIVTSSATLTNASLNSLVFAGISCPTSSLSASANILTITLASGCSVPANTQITALISGLTFPNAGSMYWNSTAFNTVGGSFGSADTNAVAFSGTLNPTFSVSSAAPAQTDSTWSITFTPASANSINRISIAVPSGTTARTLALAAGTTPAWSAGNLVYGRGTLIYTASSPIAPNGLVTLVITGLVNPPAGSYSMTLTSQDSSGNNIDNGVSNQVVFSLGSYSGSWASTNQMLGYTGTATWSWNSTVNSRYGPVSAITLTMPTGTTLSGSSASLTGFGSSASAGAPSLLDDGTTATITVPLASASVSPSTAMSVALSNVINPPPGSNSSGFVTTTTLLDANFILATATAAITLLDSTISLTATTNASTAALDPIANPAATTGQISVGVSTTGSKGYTLSIAANQMSSGNSSLSPATAGVGSGVSALPANSWGLNVTGVSGQGQPALQGATSSPSQYVGLNPSVQSLLINSQATSLDQIQTRIGVRVDTATTGGTYSTVLNWSAVPNF